MLAEVPDAGMNLRRVHLSYSRRHDVLCPRAAASLQHNQSFSLRIDAVQDNTFTGQQASVHPVDVVVLLLGSTGKDLVAEVWWQVNKVLPHFDRSTPLLAVVVAGRFSDAVIVRNELRVRQWWRVAIALQSHNAADEAPPRRIVRIFTSRPLFEPGVRCGENWSPLALQAHWGPGTGSMRIFNKTANATLFTGLPRADDLKGCTVKVAPMENAPYVMNPDNGLSGVDVSLVQYFAKTKNVTLEMLPAHRLDEITNHINAGDKRQNLSNVDPLDLLGLGHADLVIGGVLPTAQRYYSFQLSGVYTSDALRLYLVREYQVPRWQYPFAVLSAKTWALLAGTMLCVGAMLTWLNRQGAAANAMLLWGVFLEGRSFPRWMSPRTTLLVFLWVVFSLHFTAGYRATLAMANLGTITRKSASTIEDLNGRVRRVGMIDEMMLPFLKQDGLLAPLLDRVVVCRTMQNCSRLLRQSPDDVALIMGEQNMWYLSSRFFADNRGRSILQPLRGALLSYHVTTLVAKGSPILPALNDAIAHTQDGGLVPRWFRLLQTNINLYIEYSIRRASNPNGSNAPQLNMRRIVGPFACLFAGLAVATAVFLGELLCYGGQKMVGLDPDEPADDVDSPPRDVSVDAPLQAIKAEVEAEEAAEEAHACVQGALGQVTTLLVEGTVMLAEGAGRYERVTRLETEVMAALTAPGPDAEPATDGVHDGVPVDLLASVATMTTTGPVSLPEQEVQLAGHHLVSV
ncbi:uncharacterized protein LOC117650313 isoform X2 [Thrips palmi]|uniref:Uncharacterized protein LOC117650313 isoform X2 n=1 Tax=Thrips palmi TaxID=161013 RepID=A0A6P8ZVZ9_THRPL|nr:uncharacterized protein LOC117650313 isoform X2 [Thrips palmi]